MFQRVWLSWPLYSLMSRLCLAVTHETMTSYKGLDDPFAGGIGMFVQRIKLAYYLFLIPRGSTRSAYMFPYRLHTLYYIFLVVLCVAALLYLEQLWKRSRVRALSGLLALGVLPMALNFAHVMVDAEIVHSLMGYSLVFFWLLPYWPAPLGPARGKPRRAEAHAEPCALRAPGCGVSAVRAPG